MDANELEELGKELAQAMLALPAFEKVAYQVARVLSYLQSEQEKRLLLTEKMQEHAKMIERFDKQLWGDKENMENKPGLAHDIAIMKAQSRRNGKLLMGVLGSLSAFVALELLKLAMGHK